MKTAEEIKQKLKTLSDPYKAALAKTFFKTGPGQYGEGDQFMGISVPILRQVSKACSEISEEELTLLIASPFNEERLLALFLAIKKYQTGHPQEQENIYQFYLNHRQYINNWNLVDASAPYVVGAHLEHRDKSLLLGFSCSPDLWERRIAMVATWHFIRNNQFDWTVKLAEILLKDSHDLMHKAVGWMLREVGKRDLEVLKKFLGQHGPEMPRTMLRYAIEKFPGDARKNYLKQKRLG